MTSDPPLEEWHDDYLDEEIFEKQQKVLDWFFDNEIKDEEGQDLKRYLQSLYDERGRRAQ